MKKNGWIIYNGNLPGNKFLDYAQWIHEAAAKQNTKTYIIKNNELLGYLGTNKSGLLGGTDKELPDFVVFADKDIYLARQLEHLGIPVFNSSKAIESSDDKITSYQQLAIDKLPIPKTIIAPKIFSGGEIDPGSISATIEELGFPMIIKEAFGSFGEQVYLVKTEKELNKKVLELQGKAFIFQEFISSSYGKDMRLQVVGDKVVAAMKRTAANDFRANVTAGGKMENYQPTEKEAELAVLATKAIGADFAGVDLLFGPDNNSLICEINSNAHIHNMYDCTGINVADHIVAYILEILNNE